MGLELPGFEFLALFLKFQFFIDFGAFWDGFGMVLGGFREGLGRVWEGFGKGLGRFGMVPARTTEPNEGRPADCALRSAAHRRWCRACWIRQGKFLPNSAYFSLLPLSLI